MKFDDPERAFVLVVLGLCLAPVVVSVVVVACQPPPPPPPRTDIVGLFLGIASALSPSSAPSVKPGESGVTPSAAAPSALASLPPSAPASVAPSSAARRVPRVLPAGTASRRLGESDIVDPWGRRGKR